MTDDNALLRRIQDGDHSLFRKLYDSHVGGLYRFLHQFSRSQDETEEWVQRTFIKAFDRIGSFDGRSRFSSWLFAIGLNEMRSDRRRRAILDFEPLEEGLSIVQDYRADDFLWNDLMREWLNQLSEIKKAVFILAEVEGYSHAEIASMLQIKESTSRAILTRTKQWLQHQWNEERRTGT